MGVATERTGGLPVPTLSPPVSRNNVAEREQTHREPERTDVDGNSQPNLSSSPNIVDPTALIDNSRNIYIPIQLGCGIRVLCRPDVLTRCPLILQDLNSDLCQCLSILPRSVHHLVKRTQIWVNLSYSYGLRDRPVVLNHSAAHHHEAWLFWARDRPDKTLGIEIYNSTDFRKMRLHWNGCGLILHELCHLIHQQVLPGGLENRDVVDAYTSARNSGKYDTVLRRDWAGKDLDCDLAYAMCDAKEFFAEISVSFWSSNYPELDNADRSDIYLCSPPIIEPTVLARIRDRQQLDGSERPEQVIEEIDPDRHPVGSFLPQKGFAWLLRLIENYKRRGLHCNKFYPFTTGQLRSFDPNSYKAIDSLWRQIAQWGDPNRAPICSKPIGCWNPWRGQEHQRVQVVANVVADTIDF